MSRLQPRFQALAKTGRKALIPFITAGFPQRDWTVSAMHQLVTSGADVIELGVPFSDPMADGPVIQQASEQAIAQGVCLQDVLAMVSAFRQDDPDTPVVLMGYLNPLERYGYAAFVEDAADAGVDGLLLVDSPVEESGQLQALLVPHAMDQIFLVAPTTDAERLPRILQAASGFVYYVSLKGVTGSSQLNTDALAEKIASIRALSPLPVAVGFGVDSPDSARTVACHADAVVIGSALVKVMGLSADRESLLQAIDAFLAPVRAALDSLEP
jgi:tryptophan synthase alpha chain